MGRIVGIDLGTTYSAVASFNEKKGKFEIVRSRQGTATTPSVVAYKDGTVLVGEDAKKRMALDPDNTVTQIKRHMGEPFYDGDEPRLGPDRQPVPYTCEFAGKNHTPQMISAYVLKELKALAEEQFGDTVTGAVITVPAYFKGGPRRATEEAGKLAGLEVKCLVSEPTAAAIAFGLDTRRDDDDDDDDDFGEDETSSRRVLVYDLGGGTFDVSIIEISDDSIEVRGVDGDHHLGGVDFDNAIIEWALSKIQAEYGVDLKKTEGVGGNDADMYKKAYSRIFAEAEKMKIALSTQQTATLSLPYLFPHDGDMVNIEYDLSRNDFLTRIAPKLKGTLKTVDRALKDAGLEKKDIDDIILVGGSTQIPKIRQMVEKHFGKPPRKDINPDECVAMGAAMQALRYVPTDEVSPEIEEMVEEQLDKMGSVIDITGHSLGVREGADNMSVLIPKNSPIPAGQEQIYQTGSDFQKEVVVAVYQGEDPVASKNTKLTEFKVAGLKPLPAGQVKIKIGFELDINGVLTVQATDLLSNKPHTVTTSYGGAVEANPDDLADLASAAAASAPGRGGANGHNVIPSHMQDTWDQAQSLLGKLAGSKKQQLETAMQSYRDALSNSDVEVSQERADALMDALFDVME